MPVDEVADEGDVVLVDVPAPVAKENGHGPGSYRIPAWNASG
jgi:hypothetical protein